MKRDLKAWLRGVMCALTGVRRTCLRCGEAGDSSCYGASGFVVGLFGDGAYFGNGLEGLFVFKKNFLLSSFYYVS